MFIVDKEKCIACKQCINDCPVNDIILKDNKAHVKNESCIKCGHCVAICPTKAVSTNDYDMDDVIEYNKESFTVDADNLLNFIKFRRSIRNFKSKKIEKEKIEKIIEAGRFTQTSTNSQDVSYTIVIDKLDKLKDLAFESLNKKGEYILNHLTPETEYLKRYATLWTYFYKLYKEDPIKNDKLFFNAFYSGFLQIATNDNNEILDFLHISDNKKIVACMVVGYPNVKYKRTVPRKAADIKWI